MATESQILNYLLAWELSFKVGGTPDEIIEVAKAAIKSHATREVPEPDVNEADVVAVYKAYPSRDVNCNNRDLHKCSKDKTTIRKLLKYVKKEALIEAIESYVNECNRTGSYKKNFTTFLNSVAIEDLYSGKNPEKEDLWQ